MSPGVTDRMAPDLRMPLGAYGGSVSCHHRRGYDSSAPMIAPRDRWSVEPMCGNHTVTVLQRFLVEVIDPVRCPQQSSAMLPQLH